jgi:hypothetical protein
MERPTGDAPDHNAPAPGDAAALEQRYAERLLDDEALRADLTDDEFAPAQAWALDRLHARVAAQPAAGAAEHELEQLVAALRAVLQALNDLVGRRLDLSSEQFAAGVEALGATLTPALYDSVAAMAAARERLRQQASALAAQKDTDDGAALVAALLAALDAPVPRGEETG